MQRFSGIMCELPFFFPPALLCGVWDLSSLTRDQTRAPCNRSKTFLTLGLPYQQSTREHTAQKGLSKQCHCG